MMQRHERSSSESYFWPTIWAVGLHALIFATLFVSFAMTPELPPSRPIVQATLYQLKSQSQATVQTNQRIAGEAQKTAAPQYETEQMEQRKVEEQRLAAAKAAEQKRAEEARKAAEAQKQKEVAAAKAEAERKAAAAKAEAEKKAAEQAEIARRKAAEEAAKKKAAEEAAKKKVAEEAAKKKAAEEAAKQKAAEEARKKAAAEAAARARKAEEDKKAAALAELLSDRVQHQQALADSVGDQVAGNLDDLIISLVSQQWRRPPSARRGMSVTVTIQMLPDGTITNASVTRSSGDVAFDNSAVAAVRNVGRIPEMQQLDRATFDRMYRQRAMIFKPEDLSL
ncbi:cell envelope integrity protein TolA [Pseudomonas stutzeri]|nr:cell envelope integrity protein TolA [Stutzerimonas stutzeri]